MKLEHASTIGKKISSFARVVREIFNFYFGKLTFEPPCIWPKSHDIKKNLNIFAMARADGSIFFTDNRSMFTLEIHMGKIRRATAPAP